MVDTIVIGAGVAGAVVAGQLARKKNEKVLLIDRRSHIGGNCYDEYDEYGILIHKYGPHIFHTNDETVYEYFSEYTDWILFGHEVKANVYGKLICVPFNLNTLHMVYEKEKADRRESELEENRAKDAADLFARSSPLLLFRLPPPPSTPSPAAHHLATVEPANRARGRAATTSGSGRCYRHTSPPPRHRTATGTGGHLPASPSPSGRW